MKKLDEGTLEREVSFRFSHSSGPGGQNVNKLNTKVTLRWSPARTELFTDTEKERILSDAHVQARCNSDDEIVLQVEDTRSQGKNRELALERLVELIQAALRIEKPRKPTKPSRSAVRRQKEAEKKHREKKSRRSWKPE